MSVDEQVENLDDNQLKCFLLDNVENNRALAIVATDERAFYDVDTYCDLIAMPVRSSLKIV